MLRYCIPDRNVLYCPLLCSQALEGCNHKISVALIYWKGSRIQYEASLAASSDETKLKSFEDSIPLIVTYEAFSTNKVAAVKKQTGVQ